MKPSMQQEMIQSTKEPSSFLLQEVTKSLVIDPTAFNSNDKSERVNENEI